MQPDEFRSIMRQQASAVAVIAAGSMGRRAGLTATAVCSLSDSPPMILVCVNQNASAYPTIIDAGCFSVNWLATHQDAIAARFAGRTGLKAEQRFGEGSWGALSTGAPVLEDALASLDCELIAEHVHATHSILIGRVCGARKEESSDPLLYFAGRFAGLAAQQPASA